MRGADSEQVARGDDYRRHAVRNVTQGRDRIQFYLAIPTLIGAGAYSMWKQRGLFVAADVPLFAVGLLAFDRRWSASAG